MFLTDALLALVYPQSCRICEESVEQRRFGVVCEACWRRQIFTDQVALGWYDGALRETVLMLKRQPYLPRYVIELLIEAGKSFAVTRVIPVPLHKDRLRTRGFNKAAVIGREMSRALGVPMDEVSLVRVSSSEKYRTGLDAKGRQDTVAGAFQVRFPRLIAGEDVL